MATYPAIPINTTGGIGEVSIDSVTGLPSSLSYVDNGDGSGQIIGTIADGSSSGSPYSVTVSASNTADQQDSEAFTITVEAPSVPSGAVIDMDANALVGVISEGGTITTGDWLNAGTGGTNTSTVLNSPQFLGSGINGAYPGVRFDDPERVAVGMNTALPVGDRTICAVVQANTGDFIRAPFSLGSLTEGIIEASPFNNNTPPLFWNAYLGSGSLASSNGSRVLNQAQIITVVLDDGADTATLYVDGVLEDTAAAPNSPTTRLSFTIGENSSTYTNGLVGRVMAWGRALDSTELSDLHSALADQWGITL